MSTAAHRIFRSEDAALAAVTHLVRNSAWFELTPLPCGRWQLKVKADVQHLLPEPKNWDAVTDDELLELAQESLDSEFCSFTTGEARWDNDAQVVGRWGTGFVVRTDVWVRYPEYEV